MGPLGILAFLLLYGLASLSEDVAEWERVEPSLVAAMAAMFVVGVGLVLGQIVLAAKRRFFGLAIVAGLIAAFDATATGALLVWGEVSELGGASPVAFALFLQIAIIGLAIKEIKAAQ